MSQRSEPQPNGEMEEAVRRREREQEIWRKSGERPVWRNLSMIGALGWLVITPTLLGVVIGRWLDATFGTGIMWSGAFIFGGVALGAYLAWQRIQSE